MYYKQKNSCLSQAPNKNETFTSDCPPNNSTWCTEMEGSTAGLGVSSLPQKIKVLYYKETIVITKNKEN